MQVNGWSNYNYPRQRWIRKLVHNIIIIHLDLERVLLPDLLNADDLPGGFLKLPELTEEIPEPRSCDNRVGSEDTHPNR